MIGKMVGHYRIVSVLGTGGMGTVYRADDLRLQRPVAIKFVSPHLSRDPEAHQRLLREARSASALDHPHIGVVYEVAETDDGQLYIVMALYEGGTLRQRLDQGPLPIDEALRLGRQITEGLAAAHAAGIVHRDLKPENILLTRDGQVRIVDFGLAKSQGQTRMTRTGSAAGTVAYMSPEQARGDEVDARTDLFSLGVILYEMLGGRPPFRGDSDSAVLYQVVHEEPPALEGLRSEVPKPLRQVVIRLLAKDPSERYQGAAAVLVDLGSGRVRRRWPRRRVLLAATGAIAILSLTTWWAWPRYLSETARFKREIVRLQNDKRPLVIAVAPFAATGAAAENQAKVLRGECLQELNKFFGGYDQVQLLVTEVSGAVRTKGEALRFARGAGADVVLWGEVIAAADSLQLQPYLTATERALLQTSGIFGTSTLALQVNRDWPRQSATVRAVRSMVAVSAAGFLARRDQCSRALAILDTVPDQTIDVIAMRAELLRLSDRSREAESLCRQGLARWPTAVAILEQQGMALEMLGRMASVDSVFREIVAIDSVNPRALNYLGYVARQQGRFSDASTWFRMTLKAGQDRTEMSLVESGAACTELGMYDEARRLCIDALELNPFGRSARMILARTLMYLGDYSEAQQHFEILAFMYPNWPGLRHALVRSLVACNRVDDSERLCREVPTDNSYLRDFSGRLYLLDRDWTRARADFIAASDRSPSLIYPAIMSWLAIQGSDGEQAARMETAGAFARCAADDYGSALLGYFGGAVSEEVVIAATTSEDANVQNRRLCEAYFCIGMRYLIAAERAGDAGIPDRRIARDYLQRCLDTGIKGYTEYLFARLELKRIKDI